MGSAAETISEKEPEKKPSLLDLPDGLHAGIPHDVFCQPHLGCVSLNSLAELARSPLHYKAHVDRRLEPEEKKDANDALDFGAAWHMSLLEPVRFAQTYAVEPDVGDRRFKAAREKLAEWKKENEGKIALSAEQAEAIKAMSASVRAHPLAGKMLDFGEPEVTILWTDPETGLRCRARADYYVRSRAMVVDIKSTQDASYEAFRKDIFRFGYHRQSALYRLGFAALALPAKYFVFVAVEKTPPYAVGVYTVDDMGIAIAHERNRALINQLAECMKHNRWDGYPVEIRTVETPQWVSQ